MLGNYLYLPSVYLLTHKYKKWTLTLPPQLSGVKVSLLLSLFKTEMFFPLSAKWEVSEDTIIKSSNRMKTWGLFAVCSTWPQCSMETQWQRYTLNLSRNHKAKEDRLELPSASGPLCPVLPLAAALLSWRLLCSQRITVAAGTIESRRGNTPCPWNLKMSSRTHTHTHIPEDTLSRCLSQEGCFFFAYSSVD